jgi:hypothetical protein
MGIVDTVLSGSSTKARLARKAMAMYCFSFVLVWLFHHQSEKYYNTILR